MNKKRTLVTGGAGQLGLVLVNLLLEKGHDVTIVDHLKKPNPPILPQEAQLHCYDLTADSWPMQLVSVLRSTDTIFHLAGATNPVESIRLPHLYHNNNVKATLNLLIAANDAEVSRVVFASQSYKGSKMINPYRLQKYMAELYCSSFSSIYGLETVSLRFPSLRKESSDKFLSLDDGAQALLDAALSKKMGQGEVLSINKKFLNGNNF
jgi:nucleoside-diphosphate-sugar epimerase